MCHIGYDGDLFEVDAFTRVVGAREEEHAWAVEVELRRPWFDIILVFSACLGLGFAFRSWSSNEECVIGDTGGYDVALEDVPAAVSRSIS